MGVSFNLFEVIRLLGRMKHAFRFTRRLVPILFLFLVWTTWLRAQEAVVDVVPPELYPGENILTVGCTAGIKEISTTYSSNVTVEGDGSASCEKSHQLKVFVNTASDSAWVGLRITDCQGGTHFFGPVKLNTVWQVDRINMGRVELGESDCEIFQIRNLGVDVILDSITTPETGVRFRLPTSLPARIIGLYRYEVCFRAERTGVYKFPVITWLRRPYPSGGHTTYAVADTGYVRVYRHAEPTEEVEEPLTDPTTFRTIVVPNAVIPRNGTFFLGSYDFLGLEAGYSIGDHLMILAGGALPTPDDWGGVRGEMFGAYSIGAKVGLPIGDRLNVALGYQWGSSLYDKQLTEGTDSKIGFSTPYGSISYGDDDSRISATFGYAFKHHVTPDAEFDRNATILALGGDYRFAHNWKIAGEIAGVESLGALPLIATARYFGERYAIDFGAAFLAKTDKNAKTPSVPLVPILSGVFLF
jgi:hypothetical protein